MTVSNRFSFSTIPTASATNSGRKTNLFRSGYYYVSDGMKAPFIPSQNRVYYSPFWIGETTSFDRLGVTVTLGQLLTTCRLGVYADSGHGAPSGVALVSTGSLDTSLGASVEVSISKTLAPGLYWLASVTQGGVVQPTLDCLTSLTTSPVGSSTLAGATGIARVAYYQDGIAGALASFSETGQTIIAPAVALRAQ